MYGNKNLKHYNYFDYRDNNGQIQQYEPDSDMEFTKFKIKMQEEWINKNIHK